MRACCSPGFFREAILWQIPATVPAAHNHARAGSRTALTHLNGGAVAADVRTRRLTCVVTKAMFRQFLSALAARDSGTGTPPFYYRPHSIRCAPREFQAYYYWVRFSIDPGA
eukprot:gene3921-biopygen740